jgi:Fic family protein
MKLFAKDRSKIETLRRASESALRVHELMQTNPYIRIRTATKVLGLTVPTVTNALNNLVRLGIVKEVSGKQRDRLFAYSRYVGLVSGNTEPL